MSAFTTMKNLLTIKVAASSTITNLQPLIRIQTSFQADEQELQDKAVEISVRYTFAVTELRAVISQSEALLYEPPSYGKDAEAQEYAFYSRALELQILCRRTHDEFELAKMLVCELAQVAIEAGNMEEDKEKMTLAEVKVRAVEALRACSSLKSFAKKVVVASLPMSFDVANIFGGNEDGDEENEFAVL